MLEVLARSRSAPHQQVRRAQALLSAAAGEANTRIAERLGVTVVDGAHVAYAVRGGRACRSRGDSSGARAQAVDPTGEGRGDRARDTAREAARGDALELSFDGQGAGRQPGDGAADLVGARVEAPPGGDVQALERQAVRGEARRCRRPVSEPAGERDRAVHGRKEPDPGARSHPAVAADEAGQGRHDDPRLQAQRHHHAVRRARRAHRLGDRPVPAPSPPQRVPEVPAHDRPRGPQGTGDPPDPRQLRNPQARRTSSSGSPSTLASTCTSPRPRAPG